MIFRGMIINIFAIVGLSLLISGCSSDIEDRNQEVSNSTFTVDMVTSVELTNQESRGQWGLKSSKIINVQACLKDRALGNAIIDQPFIISGGELEEIRVVSDISGCLFWEERVKFNFLADESYLMLSRKISGAGNYSGTDNLELALNPWSSAAVVDARQGKQTVKSYLNESEQMSSSLTIREKSNLLLDDVGVSFLGDSVDYTGAPHIELKVEFVPKLVRVGLMNNIIHETLTKGKFDMRLKLLERKHGEEQRQELAGFKGEVSIVKGAIQSEVKMELMRPFNRNSIIELMIEVTPIDGPSGLTSEQGVLLISLDKARSSGKLHSISKDELTAIDELSRSDEQLNSDEISINPLSMDIVKIRPGVFDGQGKNGIVRRRMATFTICLKESISPKVVNDQSFLVQLLSSEGESIDQSELPVDLNGCIEYRPWISFNYTQGRRWFGYQLHLTGQSGLYDAVELRREIYINPWQSDSDFGIDGTVGRPPKGGSEQTRIVIDQLSYNSLGNDRDKFDLDKFLNLSLEKRFEVTFSPQMEYFNFSTGEKELSSLNFGEYRLRALILSPKRTESSQVNSRLQDFNMDDYIVLSGSEVPVTIGANGLVQETLSFPLWFSELSMLILKNKLLVELSPVNPDSKISSVIVLARFNAAKNFLSGVTQKIDLAEESLVNFNQSMGQEITRRLELTAIRHQKQENLPSTLELFHQELARLDNLADATFETSFLNTSEFAEKTGVNLSKSDIQNYIRNKGKEYIKELCHLYYRKSGSFIMGDGRTRGWSRGMRLQKCLYNPIAYLDIQTSEHVEQVNSLPTMVPELTRQSTLNITDGFFIASTHAQTKGAMEWTAFQTEFGVGLSKFIGIGPSVSVYNTHVIQSGNEDRIMDMRRYSTNITSDLQYESLGLSFQASVQKCILVTDKQPRIKPAEQSWLSKIIVGEQKVKWWVNGRLLDEKPKARRFHICLDAPVEERIDEEWFFVKAEKQQSNQLFDRSEAELNEFTFTMRGQNKFKRLRDFFQAKEGLKVIQSMKDIELIDRYQRMLERGTVFEFEGMSLDGSVPGLLVR
jgi:hypothetical protein